MLQPAFLGQPTWQCQFETIGPLVICYSKLRQGPFGDRATLGPEWSKSPLAIWLSVGLVVRKLTYQLLHVLYIGKLHHCLCIDIEGCRVNCSCSQDKLSQQLISNHDDVAFLVCYWMVGGFPWRFLFWNGWFWCQVFDTFLVYKFVLSSASFSYYFHSYSLLFSSFAYLTRYLGVRLPAPFCH